MSTNAAKEDNLVQLKTNDDNSENVRVNNKLNNLEKTLNDTTSDFKKTTSELKKQINTVSVNDSNLEKSVNETLEKIASVDKEISQLYKDIDHTNVNISKSVEKIESEQTDLSTKVSETYKQLGSVEKSYTALKTKSTKITKDIKAITTQVETISDEIRQQIISLETNTQDIEQQLNTVEKNTNTQVKSLSDGQEELIEKTNAIVKEAKITATALEKSISENTALMTSIESKLISEIEALAKDTDSKTAALAKDMDSANDEIKAHSAKMLKLQSVDEALEKRADKLEITAKTLSTETAKLFKATETLDQRSTALEDSVETLGIKIYRIEQENEIQQAQLDELRRKSKETNNTLAALSRLVSFNFVATGGFLTLLVAAVVSLYLYQDNLWSTDAITTAERTSQVDQKITGLKQHVNTNDTQAADRIAQLESQVVSLNQELKSVNDKNTSLDNRLVNIAPHRKIGNDNILHSLQWINQQPAANHTIHVLTASSEEEVFELAVRYNHNLTDVLSYKTVQVNNELQYLLYMGNYSDLSTAEAAIDDLPFRLNGQEPSLTTFKDIK